MSLSYRIEPVSDDHVEGLQSVVDSVAQERRYLATVHGFPLEQVRQFVESTVSDGGVQLVVLDGDRVVGWCDVRRNALEVFASNAPAVHLFEKAGFVTEGVKRRARILDDQEDDVVCMALLL